MTKHKYSGTLHFCQTLHKKKKDQNQTQITLPHTHQKLTPMVTVPYGLHPELPIIFNSKIFQITKLYLLLYIFNNLSNIKVIIFFHVLTS